ncbi:LON peptidase substrate-binding domain-containing protein [Variovorax sp. JS1663]|uniref:LON peptidase substrate-binding domain-containing protein n=1 Tax=Variovorax sp. JS1663 TaxID=1851577 RepID=UPI000B3434EE|nr:LON peptidase substrate-binding domain-containing protein [Variovorax sp. JS1663]OUM00587.1 hypothetical protein A8M77_20010 [Variovorax sp. JS1663]
MSDGEARGLAERRLAQFERALQAAAASMGEADPAGLARSALDLAAHAALPVALDPGLLHLLRINFFFDRERVPHWVEARLLLSTLCREAEGNGLYVMDAPVRELLLMRLVAHHGQKRLEAVATLLWLYAERHGAWMERSELRHAQQLTAVNFVDPAYARAWMAQAEGGGGSASLSRQWFLAMREAMPALPPAPQGGDPAVVCKALRELDFVAQRAAHREALRQSETGMHLIRGPRVHGHRWVLLRLLGHYERAPALLWLAPDSAHSRPLRASLAIALGLEARAPWWPIHHRATYLARARPLVIAIDGVERLDDAQRTDLRDLLAAELPASIYLLDRAEGSEAVIGEGALASVMLLTGSSGLLPPLGRIAHDDLRYWIDRHGGEAGLDGLAPKEAEQLAEEILAATGGIPERVLEQLCVRCGVRWPDVLAAAETPFGFVLPSDEAITELAEAYERRRGDMQPGPARTQAMEEIVRRMRELLASREDWPLQAWTGSASPGLHLAAAVLLQLRPEGSHCAWLGERVGEETPFITYHALLALKAAARQLPAAELGDVNAAVLRAERSLPSRDADTDRGLVLRDTRRLLDERRQQANPNFLPLMPLRGVVLFPGREARLLLTRPESTSSLFKVQNGGDNAVFCVLDESTGDTFDPRLMRQVGTIAAVRHFETTETGTQVTLSGIARALGTPMQDPAEGGAVLVRTDPLSELSKPHALSWERDSLVQALRALVRIGGAGGRTVELAGAAPVPAWYELADLLSLAPAQKQTLLQADRASEMLAPLRDAAVARIEDGLPEDFGADGWGLDRLAALLGIAFGDADLRTLFGDRRPDKAGDSGAIAALVQDAATGGRLRGIAAQALARRPDDDALWEHVEAMTQQPEHPRASKPKPARKPRAGPLKLWPNGSTLRIRFIGGDPALRKRVMRCAAQWFEHANLRYQVLSDRSRTPADIRIAFDPQAGSWSYVGIDARSVPANQPTMNFGWLTPSTPDAELQRVVLKEFGHALGLWQEHKNPDGGIEWDREAVMKMYAGPPNHWSREQVEHNILGLNPPSVPPYRPFDPHSVMLHDFPAEMLLSRQAIHGGTVLSDSDKAFIAALYPQPASAKPPTLKAPVRKR